MLKFQLVIHVLAVKGYWFRKISNYGFEIFLFLEIYRFKLRRLNFNSLMNLLDFSRFNAPGMLYA